MPEREMEPPFDSDDLDLAERLAAQKIAAVLDPLTNAERAHILRWAHYNLIPPPPSPQDWTVPDA